MECVTGESADYTVRSKMMKASGQRKLSKCQIAERQIYRAFLVLEEQDDPVSAFTLAGAAEEILGNFLRDRIECAFEAKVK